MTIGWIWVGSRFWLYSQTCSELRTYLIPKGGQRAVPWNPPNFFSQARYGPRPEPKHVVLGPCLKKPTIFFKNCAWKNTCACHTFFKLTCLECFFKPMYHFFKPINLYYNCKFTKKIIKLIIIIKFIKRIINIY